MSRPARSLPQITIPVACTADWDQMRPMGADARARLCGACKTPVYDGRSLTRGELQRLILEHEGELPCLRLLRRPDGTIVTRSCFAPVLRVGRFLWLKVGLAAVAFWSALFALRGATRRPDPVAPPPPATAALPASRQFVITLEKAADNPEPASPPVKPKKKPNRPDTILGKLAIAPDDRVGSLEDLLNDFEAPGRRAR